MSNTTKNNRIAELEKRIKTFEKKIAEEQENSEGGCVAEDSPEKDE